MLRVCVVTAMILIMKSLPSFLSPVQAASALLHPYPMQPTFARNLSMNRERTEWKEGGVFTHDIFPSYGNLNWAGFFPRD